MPTHAHTHPDFPSDPSHWEPLFTPFGSGAGECQKDHCGKCRDLTPDHGHLNKVAFWTAKFASEMFPQDSPAAKSAHEWGYLAGLWHDLGKFAPEWQKYLQSKANPHIDDVSGKVDHSTAGAQHSIQSHSILGHLLGYGRPVNRI